MVIFFLRKSFWDKTQYNLFKRTISHACGHHQLTWGEIGGPRDAFCEVYLGAIGLYKMSGYSDYKKKVFDGNKF